MAPTTSRRGLAALASAAVALGCVTVAAGKDYKCPGEFPIEGYGQVSLIPTGWHNVSVMSDGRGAQPHLTGRAYFADRCVAGHYNNEDYVALNLLGKTLKFTTDVSGAGCGCNAAMYLTSMRQNTDPSTCLDYYCDANSVCGVSCSEIDIMEANLHAWHSTLHSPTDHDGKGAGFGGGSTSGYAGWNGPRDWTEQDYSPGGNCIDTNLPFQVEVSFPTDNQGVLIGLEVTLSQVGKSCPLAATVTDYKGLASLSKALEQGMTPIVSYWSDNGMLWLDGEGKDGKGPCHVDHANRCGSDVKFYDFSIEKIGGAALQEYHPIPTPSPPPIVWEQPTPAPTMTTWAWAAPAPQWTPAPTTTVPQWTPAPTTTPQWTPAPTTTPAASWQAEQPTAGATGSRVIVSIEDDSAEESNAAQAKAQHDAETQAVAMAKKRAASRTVKAQQSGCFTEGSGYLPLNMEGEDRSVEVDAAACQDRCHKTAGCVHFSYWHSDGGCHLQDSDAKPDESGGSDVISGPANCQAEAFCHKYIEQQGCGWTISHSCPGQIPGKIGLARDDGTKGFQCCCVYEMWKQDKWAAKRAAPKEPQEKKEAPMLCTASHGAALGEEVCCGQEGFVKEVGHICPKSHPTCVGLVSHVSWGTCQVAQPWQQCGGVKDGEPWWGPTSCIDGFECKAWSTDYSQCYKAGGSVVMMKEMMMSIPTLLYGWRSPGTVAFVTLVAASSIMMVVARLGLQRRRAEQARLLGRDLSGEDLLHVVATLPSRPSATSLLSVDSCTV